MFVRVRGFDMQDLLWEGPRYLTYRAIRQVDQCPLAVKMARPGNNPSVAANTLELESRLAAELDGVVPRPIAMLHPASGPVLVQELPGGASLSELIANGLDLPAALKAAIAVCRCLDTLHARRIVHNDLRPGGIFFDEHSDRAVVMDLSAAYVPSWRGADRTLALAERDLARLAPEQTGRTSHTIDHRADLYTLGVILFEALERELPFDSSDAAALVHAHLASSPERLRERLRRFPAPIADIVIKLMAKNPEQRYRGAYGVRRDLERCAAQLSSGAAVEPFALCSDDCSPRPETPSRLFGRDAAVAALRGASEMSRTGELPVVVVSGPPGTGKTSVVFAAFALAGAFRFVDGKVDAVARETPYGGILQACRSLVRQLVAESAGATESWKAALDKEDRAAAAVLLSLLPELAFLVGPQPALPDVEPLEQQHRVERAFHALFSVAARADRPLVVFLDDVDRADSGTLALLTWLWREGRPRHTLFVVTRSDRGEAGMRGSSSSSWPESAGISVENVKLEPLSKHDTREMLAAIIGPQLPDLAPLADVICEKTGGNPHFILEFVRRLHAGGLLWFDVRAGHWRADLGRIYEAEATENVRDLLKLRIQALPAAARAVLSTAACLSGEFSAETVVAVLGGDAQVREWLPELAREGVLIEIGDEPASPRRRFRFIHDGVQEASHALLSDEHRAVTHRAIGRHLLARSGDLGDQDLYAAVNHLNAGLPAIAEVWERQEVGRLNLRAGSRALSSAAFADASRYLTVAVALLPASPEARAERFAAHLGLARAGYVAGLPDQSEGSFQRALVEASTDLERAEVYGAMVPYHTQQGRGQSALDACLEGLRCVGVRLPSRPAAARLLRRAPGILWRLGRLGPEGVARREAMTDPKHRMTMRLLMTACLPATTLVRPTLVALVALEMADLSMRHGITDEAAFGFVLIALFSAQLGLYERAHAMGRVALDIANRGANTGVRSWVLMFFAGFLGHLKEHLGDSITLFEQGYRLCLRSGEHLQGSMIIDAMLSFMPSTGFSISALQERAGEGIALAREMRRGQTLATARAVLRWTSALAGGEPPAASPSDADLIAAQQDARWQVDLLSELLNVQSQYVLGRYDDALASARVVLRRPYLLRLAACYHEFFAFYYALTIAALTDVGRAPRFARLRMARAQRFLRRVARRCPANGTHRHALVAAERARVDGRADRASQLYEQAIAAAAANGFPHEEALARERAGWFHLRRGRPEVALRQLHAAREGYASWGAARKVVELDRELAPALRASDRRGNQITHLDLDSVIRGSRAISGEIVLGDLIARLMTMVVENAGAERGYLLFERDGRLMVEAEAVIGQPPVIVPPTPADGDPRVPWSIVNYVARTGESVVLGDASRDESFRFDAYIAARRTRSVLSAPLLNQGRLMAVIYLENNLGAGVFSAERLQVVTLLLAQAALSLHNASLYDSLRASNAKLEDYSRTLERKVEERTSELHRIQRQLVTQEKLASLGTITAGIAHELRNPLNFVSNFAELSEEMLSDLSEQLLPGLSTSADAKVVRELIDSLRGNAQRIREHGKRANDIISSMLLHARSSTAVPEEIDFPALVSESIGLAVEGARVQMPGLDVQVEPSLAPEVGRLRVRVGDIQRVMVNLVNNACYAVWIKRRQVGAAFSPRIAVVARVINDRVELRIRDNGIGIPREIAERLFTPFLTTKAPGEGTGLGLSLSHDIVVHGHGGELTIDSVPGEHTEVVVQLPLRSPPVRLTDDEVASE